MEFAEYLCKETEKSEENFSKHSSECVSRQEVTCCLKFRKTHLAYLYQRESFS